MGCWPSPAPVDAENLAEQSVKILPPSASLRAVRFMTLYEHSLHYLLRMVSRIGSLGVVLGYAIPV